MTAYSLTDVRTSLWVALKTLANVPVPCMIMFGGSKSFST